MSSGSTTTLELAWRPEFNDYAEALRARNKARGMPTRLAAVIAISVAVAAAGAIAQNVVVAAAGGGIVLGVLAVVLVLQPLNVRALWRRNPALHADVRATVDPATGITVASQTTGQFPWPSVDSYLETDRVFVVQLSGYRALNFFVLAKRGAGAPGDVDDVRRQLAAGTAR